MFKLHPATIAFVQILAICAGIAAVLVAGFVIVFAVSSYRNALATAEEYKQYRATIAEYENYIANGNDPLALSYEQLQKVQSSYYYVRGYDASQDIYYRIIKPKLQRAEIEAELALKAAETERYRPAGNLGAEEFLKAMNRPLKNGKLDYGFEDPQPERVRPEATPAPTPEQHRSRPMPIPTPRPRPAQPKTLYTQN
jgi:hypothetical protein